MAEPRVTAASDQPAAAHQSAAQPHHLLAIGSGLALIVGAASNQAVSLSSQVLPQLPAPGIPLVRLLVGVVGGCVMGWGLWGMFGAALMKLARLQPWRRSEPVVAVVDEDVTAALPQIVPVEVRLRCDYAVVVDLNSTVPNVSLWFEVISHLDIDATLERIVFQLWAGQPVLSGTMDHRHAISRHSTYSSVHFHGQLTAGAVEQIRREMAKRAPRGKYTVYGTGYFASTSGPFEVQLRNQERDIPPVD